MDFFTILLVIGIVLMLISNMSPPAIEPEYVLVPIQHPRESLGCLPAVVAILLCIFVVALLLGEGQH